MVRERVQGQEAGRSGESPGELRQVGTQVSALQRPQPRGLCFPQGSSAPPTPPPPYPLQSGSHILPRLGSPIQNLLHLRVPSIQHGACFWVCADWNS